MSSSDPQIYVRGFSKNVRESDLKDAFSKFGEVKQTRLIRDYAFIVFNSKSEVDEAVKEMNGSYLQNDKLNVEVAGRPRKQKGPQPNDQCRYCYRLGHWQNDCPDFRKDRKRRRRRRRSYSSESSSSSSESSRSRERRRRRKEKKSKKHRKRSYSSSSSQSSSSGKSSYPQEKPSKRRSDHEKSEEKVDD